MKRTEPRPPWTPPRVPYVLLILALIIAANAFDTWATLIVVNVAGVGEEVNPLMRYLLVAGPAWFIAVKTGMIVGFTSALAWLSRRRRIAWIGLCLLALLYTGLAARELYWFTVVPPPTLNPFRTATTIVAVFYFKEGRSR